MGIKINCKYNDRGVWCTNVMIKRSLFGLGARCCTQYPYANTICRQQIEHKRPPPPPKPPPKRIIKEDIIIVCCPCKK